MANRSDSSPSGSRSPSVTASVASSNVSPLSTSAPLAPSGPTPTMVPTSEESEPAHSARGTPNRQAVDLPRSQAASKGGCWTCRLRRKKCDEQRQGDSCKTCLRLTIECLGWGPKRPEWMRDKQAVETYKASIKAQLTRAGLIRGQPRSSLLHPAPGTSSRPPPYHRSSAPGAETSSLLGLEGDYRRFDASHRHSMLPALPGASSPSFHQLPAASYSDSNLNMLDSFFPFGPEVPPLLSTTTAMTAEPLEFNFAQLGRTQPGEFEFDLRPPSPAVFHPLSGQNSIQGDHVMYYFEHVRKVQYIFAGNTFTNVTYSLIVQEPRGAVTNAVCALASLHFTRMRVAQGLEAPDPNPEHSNATYFHDEAYFQLATAKQLRGGYSEGDAIAALHLLSFSQLSGGATDWKPAFAVACDWLAQTGLPTDENPKLVFHNMSATGQLAAKAILWFDIFSTLSLMRAPRYTGLFQGLSPRGFWTPGNGLDVQPLRMDSLTGCPDEAMLALAEVSALAHWKASELRRRSLSVRELIRRGDDIEQRLRQNNSNPPSPVGGDQTPLHPNLQTTALMDTAVIPFPSEDTRQIVGNIFRESVVLYLYTVLNDSNPSVPEIGSSVDVVVQLLNQLQPSEVDRTLLFPICLAGSMTNDLTRREYLKRRLLMLDESIGNVRQTRLTMEAVWQKRDVSGGPIDMRETIRDHGLNLLLV
ncbi:fungal-specific transcription factor domain-containing protein [Infundibulicybe gibba]|nr:fungal-specific transcription factor domain-containing protein [Infundibulicybe gibba]